MSDNQNPPEMTPQEANVHRALFEVIEFSKKQQWAITNYVVLIYGAVFGIAKYYLKDIITATEKWAFTALTLVALGCATAMLIRIQLDAEDGCRTSAFTG